jgi:hypothetical protein
VRASHAECRPVRWVAASVFGLALLTAACGVGPGMTPRETPGSLAPTPGSTGAPPPSVGPSDGAPTEDFDAASFGDPTTIDNEWFPFAPGMHWVYEGTSVEDAETFAHRIEFTVTDLVKEIAGVRTVVAWIVDYQDDELVEKEIAFYAQATDGTVWYLGEHPEEYDAGEFVDAPTWVHGVEEAVAGIKMPADPRPGQGSFSQGWALSVEFTDRGQVAGMQAELCVPVECYPDVLIIDEYNPEEPNAFQLKYYARGVGNVATGWRGADATQEELELTRFAMLDGQALAAIRREALALEAHAYEISPELYGQTQPMD